VAKQGAFEAILPLMPAYVPILIWEYGKSGLTFFYIKTRAGGIDYLSGIYYSEFNIRL